MASDGLRHKSLDIETQLERSLRLQLPQTSTLILSHVSPTTSAEGEWSLAQQCIPKKEEPNSPPERTPMLATQLVLAAKPLFLFTKPVHALI